MLSSAGSGGGELKLACPLEHPDRHQLVYSTPLPTHFARFQAC